MTGWIKLHRSIVDWEWYNDINTKVVFFHLLLVANHKDNQWRGIEIKRGERLTSLEHLSKETNLSLSQTRTAIIKLKSTGEITSKSTNKFSLIKVNNYELYQSNDKQDDLLMTNKSHADNKQIATNKNVRRKKRKKDNDFEKFWLVFDKKKSRKKCETIWNSLPPDVKEKAITAAAAYAASTPDKKFRKHPSTWLNQECWDDEIEAPTLKDKQKEYLEIGFSKFRQKYGQKEAIDVSDSLPTPQ